MGDNYWEFNSHADPIALTDGFFYMLNNGYIPLDKLIQFEASGTDIRAAIALVNDFEAALEAAGLLEEC